MGLELRLCRPEDAPLLAPLVAALASEEGSHPAPVAAISAVIADLIASRTSDFLLAILDGRPIGSLQIIYRISTWYAARAAYFEDFYLVPEQRGQGVGTKMLEAALGHLRTQSITSVGLDVRVENTAAHRLYQRFGIDDSGSALFKGAVSADGQPATLEQRGTR